MEGGRDRRRKSVECEDKFSGGALFICYWGIERSKQAARAFKDAIPYLEKVDHLDGGTLKMNEKYPDDEDLKRRLSGYSHVYMIYDRGSRKEETQAMEAAEARLSRLNIDYTVVDTDTLASCIYDCGLDPNNYFRN